MWTWCKRQMCIQRSEWRGHVTVPKGGRLHYLEDGAPLTQDVLLAPDDESRCHRERDSAVEAKVVRLKADPTYEQVTPRTRETGRLKAAPTYERSGDEANANAKPRMM